MEIGLVLSGLGNSSLRFEQHDRLQVDPVFGRDFLFVLVEDEGLDDTVLFLKVRLHDIDILGIAIIAELAQVVFVQHLVAVFLHNVFMRVIQGGGKFQQHIVCVLHKNALHCIFPALQQIPARADVHMVGFIGQKDDLLVLEILIGQGVLFFNGQVRMQLLNGSKTDIDVMFIDAFKIDDRCHSHSLAVQADIFAEEVFG